VKERQRHGDCPRTGERIPLPHTVRARKGIRGGRGIHADELSEKGDALEAAGLSE